MILRVAGEEYNTRPLGNGRIAVVHGSLKKTGYQLIGLIGIVGPGQYQIIGEEATGLPFGNVREAFKAVVQVEVAARMHEAYLSWL